MSKYKITVSSVLSQCYDYGRPDIERKLSSCEINLPGHLVHEDGENKLFRNIGKKSSLEFCNLLRIHGM